MLIGLLCYSNNFGIKQTFKHISFNGCIIIVSKLMAGVGLKLIVDPLLCVP